MTNANTKPDLLDPDAGTARLPIVVPVALISFFYMNVLEYALPLYFDARTALAESGADSFPLDVWAQVVKYKVTPWIIGPLLAGLLARRYGERVVWCGALLGKAPIPFILAMHPHPNLIAMLALWQGLTGAVMWIAGVSLIQMVPPGKKGLSNGLMMTSMGVGSFLAPFGGRAMIYGEELGGLIWDGNWSEFWARYFNLAPMVSTPRLPDFETLFWLLTATTLACGGLIGMWGQRPGRYERDDPPSWNKTFVDLKTLSRSTKFWALVISLCLIGGPVFQASNQFLPYRAKDLGLIAAGGQDNGWIWLQLLKTLMWIPGGAAVGLLAGRRASGFAAVLMLGGFSVACLGIGGSQIAWQLFACVAAFEFVRQFMRWSHAGYMSEHLDPSLRSTAIGFAITFSGLGSVIYAWIVPLIWDPKKVDFNSLWPFVTAAVLGIVGAIGLFVFDRVHPIREPSTTEG